MTILMKTVVFFLNYAIYEECPYFVQWLFAKKSPCRAKRSNHNQTRFNLRRIRVLKIQKNEKVCKFANLRKAIHTIFFTSTTGVLSHYAFLIPLLTFCAFVEIACNIHLSLRNFVSFC